MEDRERPKKEADRYTLVGGTFNKQGSLVVDLTKAATK